MPCLKKLTAWNEVNAPSQRDLLEYPEKYPDFLFPFFRHLTYLGKEFVLPLQYTTLR